jgi:2-polyprenyl-6-hydroxyphenyl methylase / 3-demethylubiquinone-9 3-methyltransferase
MQIDNEMYFREDLDWWGDDPDNTNVLLRYFINPVRFGYFSRVIRERFHSPDMGKKILDLGCGGGFLSEEFSKAGFEVTGMDPSPHLLKNAQAHALKGGLNIKYVEGYGEKLPFETGSFDYVACCDVLEHVDDVNKVVSEIARVLRPGGAFFYDTVNRNFLSYLLIIKVAQDWKFTAWEAPRTHVWDKFVKPSELSEIMARHGLSQRELKGITPGNNIIAMLKNVRKRAKGKITRYEMGKQMDFREDNHADASYMGYGVKK